MAARWCSLAEVETLPRQRVLNALYMLDAIEERQAEQRLENEPKNKGHAQP